ncbi:helix-turn-helix transcriptional regulator [Bacillus thuringiensis]|uniref:HTH cro/C1-type domain-containing protein n=1 Tax=Bacillus thuringiensis subsp. tolworthi TaxID=1442 RepID=A0A9W4A2Y1_BACTO|nr:MULTISPECIES: helix-turn-helix transcriptional regulator [Bacillus cereus group]MEB8715962.1 helix-turn-helix transcriptional regulator [Bacillus cereus]MED2074831.1 helix-turn-helix transcriptional regulator [Bacillus thuringiensis]KIP25643.1 helix-turn-helix family protein [Bacillus thuringiensis serovar morrisoni]MEB9430841.1 helix-turn-helix transcriptional regulator [Bacillus cereus]MEB9478138.1 helix-turn-helix transcriptional regulator [Bacillus cereus]
MLDRKLPLKKEIAENIKHLMKQRGWTQLKLSKESGISKSTLSDYLNCKTLINPGNVEKIATALNVTKSKIDPSFSTSAIKEDEDMKKTQKKEDENIKTIAAHLEGKDITDEKMEDVLNYIDFIFRDQFDKK